MKYYIMKPHTLKWFKNRVGQRIFRNYFKCCPHCDDVAKNGLIISDSSHAEYLYITQNDMGNCGRILDYRDSL